MNAATGLEKTADMVRGLEFLDFTFQYESQSSPTLHHINLAIRPGEKILIAGPSGSGKSTVAHCINGLVPHAFKGECTGNYRVSGVDALKLGIFDLSKRVGTVLQDPDGQFVGLTAGEDIAFVLENDCIPTEEMKNRVNAVSSLVSIDNHLHKSPQDLSGGQKQRVSMAGVLIDDVDILLFDEPLANLDPEAGKHAIELIDRLHRTTGKTIILIEHRLEDALFRSVDRIVVMDKGRILADLAPDILLSSDILASVGIREPLYLSALKYAGVTITPALCPDHVDRIVLHRTAPGDGTALVPDQSPGQTFSDQSPDQAAQEKSPARLLREWDVRQIPVILPAPVTPLLSVSHLDFHYPQEPNRKKAVRDISFCLHRGECVSLVGRNGAGKSTLAKLICGFEKPDGGSIAYDGRDLSRDSIKQRAEHIGYVMQNPNQMISHSLITDEVAFGLRTRQILENEVMTRVEDTLQVCGLHPFRHWPISALSFGQKKRVTIASILVLRPQLLILDEPTAGQDYRHYTEIMEFLLGLNRNTGLSLLMITHDMHLMLEYTTRALVVADGNLLADDTPANILTDDDLIAAASLKRTSLFDLAVRAGIPQPRDFVQHFIDYDRRMRRP